MSYGYLLTSDDKTDSALEYLIARNFAEALLNTPAMWPELLVYGVRIITPTPDTTGWLVAPEDTTTHVIDGKVYINTLMPIGETSFPAPSQYGEPEYYTEDEIQEMEVRHTRRDAQRARRAAFKAADQEHRWDVALPFQCLKCGAPAGERCINLLTPEAHTGYPHSHRLPPNYEPLQLSDFKIQDYLPDTSGQEPLTS